MPQLCSEGERNGDAISGIEIVNPDGKDETVSIEDHHCETNHRLHVRCAGEGEKEPQSHRGALAPRGIFGSVRFFTCSLAD